MVEIKKELSEIAESWTEPEYRARPELSQSTLGTYEKLGFDGLDHLFDKVEADYFVFGSCVDSILTGGMDEFNERFSVMDINITDGGLDTMKILFSRNLPYNTFWEIPEDVVSDAAKEAGFWKADKWDKIRYKKVLETGNIPEYYEAARNSEKTLVTTTDYNDVLACVNALRESPATSGYFAENDMMSPVRRYYQLKFRMTNNNVGYRGMMDLVVVDYEDKKVYPIDLKTSGKTEWNFEKSFEQFYYMHQARLYWRLLRANMDNDEYFKDFTLENYRFIVVNRKTLTPLVWEFPLTKEYGTLVDDKGNEYRDPFVIGEELQSYLNLRPLVPNGIDKDGVNIINCLKLKE